jgi:SAM-dependent methyltransferase
MDRVRIVEKVQTARHRVEGLRHRGDEVQCTCCGSSFRRFRDQGPPNRFCWVCNAGERHRTLALFFAARPELLTAGMRLLHVAPERAIRSVILRQQPGISYESGDIDRRYGPLRIDITNSDFADAAFDAVVANHVMEHVVEDRAAMAEVFRILKPGGWAILMIPAILAAVTDEDSTVTSPSDRLERWGQSDHVRRYGWDYLDRLTAAGFDIEVHRSEEHLSEADIERYRLRDPSGGIDPVFVGRKPIS